MARASTLLAALALGGCAGSADCDTGFTDIDGLCHEAAPTDTGGPIEAFLDALPECVPGDPGDSELSDGCLRGECIGVGTWGALSAELGMSEADCDVYSVLSFCDIEGYSLTFYDADDSSSLTSADTLDELTVTSPVERDANGHGVGVSLECYVEALDVPARLGFEGEGEAARIVSADFGGGFSVRVDSGLVSSASYSTF